MCRVACHLLHVTTFQLLDLVSLWPDVDVGDALELLGDACDCDGCDGDGDGNNVDDNNYNNTNDDYDDDDV